jgi:hypothetical protein
MSHWGPARSAPWQGRERPGDPVRGSISMSGAVWQRLTSVAGGQMLEKPAPALV